MSVNAHPQPADFDLYALGVLEGAEREEFVLHLADCAQCNQSLAAAQGRVAMLALAAPQVPPSPSVRSALLARIHAETTYPAALSEPRAYQAEFPGRTSVSGSQPRIGSWWQTILVPAAAVLAILAVVLWRQNEQLDRELATLHTSVTQQQTQLDEMSHLVDLIGSTDTVTVNLAPQPGMPQGTAHVMYNMKMKMLMYDGQLAAAPAGKSYQLWVVPMNGNPVSAGVFNPTQGQTDHWMMNMPEGMVPKAFAVTIEPSGGMPQPTGPKVLIGLASS